MQDVLLIKTSGLLNYDFTVKCNLSVNNHLILISLMMINNALFVVTFV